MHAGRHLTRMLELGDQILRYFREVPEEARDADELRAMLDARSAAFDAWKTSAPAARPGHSEDELLREILRQNDGIARLLADHRRVVQGRLERIAVTRRLVQSTLSLGSEPRHIDLRG